MTAAVAAHYRHLLRTNAWEAMRAGATTADVVADVAEVVHAVDTHLAADLTALSDEARR